MEFALWKAFALQQRLFDLMGMPSGLPNQFVNTILQSMAGESSTKPRDDSLKIVLQDRFSNFIHSFSKVRMIGRNDTTDDKLPQRFYSKKNVCAR